MSKEQHATREARKKPALSLKEKRAAKKSRKDSSTHLLGADKK